MEVYVDAMLVKSKEHPDHTRHLQETFELLRRHNMKLNPLKCSFGVSSGKFLDFMVTRRGIEANPIQLKAITDSQTPASRKWVQQLTDKLAALRRFITRFTYRLKLFFATLKGAQQAGWNQECDQALTAIKQYLPKPQNLSSSEARDIFYLYLVVLEISMSAALLKEDENRKHRLIFFLSKSLFEAETRYTHLEQAALAIRVASKNFAPTSRHTLSLYSPTSL